MTSFIRPSMIAIASIVAMSACAPPPPANPMERHARLAAAAELAAMRCPGQLGGYQGATAARQDANKNIATARQMGATDEDLQKARSAVRQGFEAAVVWSSPLDACNQLVGNLAWATN